jgi:hypothetical protein
MHEQRDVQSWQPSPWKGICIAAVMLAPATAVIPVLALDASASGVQVEAAAYHWPEIADVVSAKSLEQGRQVELLLT